MCECTASELVSRWGWTSASLFCSMRAALFTGRRRAGWSAVWVLVVASCSVGDETEHQVNGGCRELSSQVLFSGSRRVVSMAPFPYREVFLVPYPLVQGLAAGLPQRDQPLHSLVATVFSLRLVTHTDRQDWTSASWGVGTEGTISNPWRNWDGFFFFFFKFQNRQKQTCPLYLVDVVCGKLCLCLQEQWAYAGCLLSLSLLWSAGLPQHGADAAKPWGIYEWVSPSEESDCCPQVTECLMHTHCYHEGTPSVTSEEECRSHKAYCTSPVLLWFFVSISLKLHTCWAER